MPLNPDTFNLQPTFPIAGVADILAQRPYREALMREVQQRQLVQGLQDFGGGVNSLVQRRIAMAQALATGRILQGLMGQGGNVPQGTIPSQGEIPAAGAVPPTPSTGTLPSPGAILPALALSGGLPTPAAPVGLPPRGTPPVSPPVPIQMPPFKLPSLTGQTPPQPPASLPLQTPQTGFENMNPEDLAWSVYGRNDIGQLMSTLMQSKTAAAERTVQTRGQDVQIYQSQMENLRSANTNAIEKYKADLLAAEAEHRITAEEANSKRQLLGVLEQKQTDLNKQTGGIVGGIPTFFEFGRSGRALIKMQEIASDIQKLREGTGMSNAASHMSTADLLTSRKSAR